MKPKDRPRTKCGGFMPYKPEYWIEAAKLHPEFKHKTETPTPKLQTNNI